LIAHATCAPPAPTSSAGKWRASQSPAAKRSSAARSSFSGSVVTTPRLPQATPSTGVPVLAAACSALRIVPSPPSAVTRSHALTSPKGATGGCSRAAICTSPRPWSSVQRWRISTPCCTGRVGWTKTPTRSMSDAAYGGYAHSNPPATHARLNTAACGEEVVVGATEAGIAFGRRGQASQLLGSPRSPLIV